ncbi:hypothetical protein [Sansalvadorimonas verongulae]|uniref:hypothetical protein n=1 Tax=Sansalvadorimonas verongulae TaxID=2172824 RepID=UPI001E3A2275|nr:hypothetical protein [Sansalvadorimonas verongulae]MTI14585.1 hypothetical protein [Sansalvadorimonas verongulae]
MRSVIGQENKAGNLNRPAAPVNPATSTKATFLCRVQGASSLLHKAHQIGLGSEKIKTHTQDKKVDYSPQKKPSIQINNLSTTKNKTYISFKINQ